MATNEIAFAQRGREKVYFANPDMDYYFSWMLGRQIFDGCQVSECFETASRIRDGDPASWQSEWTQLAKEVEAQARDALNSGESEDARIRYLRACTYYRAPLFITTPKADSFRETAAKMRACFRNAAALFQPAIETIEVPFQEHMLSGYFWKVDSEVERRPALIVFGGIETFAEDCYFMTAASGSRRGYNVMTVDLPGQEMNPDARLFFDARMQASVKAVLDYALLRPEIDGRRIALFGFSWGGHIVLEGGELPQGVRAVVADPPMPDVFRAVWDQQKGHNRADPIARVVFEQIVWRMGLELSLAPQALARRFRKAYDYLFHAKVSPHSIQCPVLCLAGEAEAPITLKIGREFYEQLAHPLKKLVIFTREDGSDLHCQVDNLALLNRVMFDWLDKVMPFERDE